MQVKREVISFIPDSIGLDFIFFILALYLLFHKCAIPKYTLQHIGRNTPPSVIFCDEGQNFKNIASPDIFFQKFCHLRRRLWAIFEIKISLEQYFY